MMLASDIAAPPTQAQASALRADGWTPYSCGINWEREGQVHSWPVALYLSGARVPLSDAERKGRDIAGRDLRARRGR